MIPVLSVKNMRESDRATIEGGISGATLMYRAALGIYSAVEDRIKWGKALIVCGSGNNAGDGYAFAVIADEAGRDCTILMLSDKLSEDGKFYYDQCIERNIKVVTDIDEYNDFDVIVDCMFGTGFHGEVTGEYRSVIDKINESDAYIVSADINSGMNGDSGRIPKGSVCVHSNLTVSIGGFKPGHFLNDAKDVIKEKTNADIGIRPVMEPYYLLTKEDAARAFPVRKNNSHKGTYGYIALIGGNRKYSGAAKLANMAGCAMRSGAGVVKLAVPKGISDAVMPYLLESTLYPLRDNDDGIVFDESEIAELISGVSTVAVGMGIGNSEETEKLLEYLLKNYKGKLVIDADGINALALHQELLECATPASIVLTPHPKEFSRLSGHSMDEILNDPCGCALEYAKKNGVIVLLKGTSTVISDGKMVYITNKGCAGMATAGSGDVLSGVIASIVSYNEDILMAVAAGSYVTGLAGEIAMREENATVMVASDTVLCIKNAIKEIIA